MHLLIDSDVFCKLEICGLLEEAIRTLEFERGNCRRLPALPHMLRRGTIFNKYGESACAVMMPSVITMEATPDANPEVLDRLIGLPLVDPGEAQLLALAVSNGDYLFTGDKKSLKAIKDMSDIAKALSGRIVILETLLMAMCDEHGPEWLRERIQPLRTHDRVVEVCFTEATIDPRVPLRSYVDFEKAALAPLILWEYKVGGIL